MFMFVYFHTFAKIFMFKHFVRVKLHVRRKCFMHECETDRSEKERSELEMKAGPVSS